MGEALVCGALWMGGVRSLECARNACVRVAQGRASRR